MIIGNAEPIKNEIIQLQLLIYGLNFLEPAVDKVLHVQARAAHEMFVWGIKSPKFRVPVWSSWPQVRNGPSFGGEHWEKR